MLGAMSTSDSNNKNPEEVVKGCGCLVLLAVLGFGAIGRWCDDAQADDEIAWISQARSDCERYEDAPNDIERSDVFNARKDFVNGKRVDGAHGTAGSIRTTHGGDFVTLTVEVGNASFKSAGGALLGIGRSNPLYEQVRRLEDGGCVVFSGTVVEANSVLERSVMCDLDYRFDFESIRPCD